MNVTIVTTYFEPEISPVTHLYAALAEDFVTYGAQVTVVTNLPQRGLDEAARAAYRARTDERTAAGSFAGPAPGWSPTNRRRRGDASSES